jgi:hypothetical protein
MPRVRSYRGMSSLCLQRSLQHLRSSQNLPHADDTQASVRIGSTTKVAWRCGPRTQTTSPNENLAYLTCQRARKPAIHSSHVPAKSSSSIGLGSIHHPVIAPTVGCTSFDRDASTLFNVPPCFRPFDPVGRVSRPDTRHRYRLAPRFLRQANLPADHIRAKRL